MEYRIPNPTFHGMLRTCCSVHLAQRLQRLYQFPEPALFVDHISLENPPWRDSLRHARIAWSSSLPLDPDDPARRSDPASVPLPLTGLVVLNEIQTRPDLFPLLRVLADRTETPARFLILGNATPELLWRAAESLADRVTFQELEGSGLDGLVEDAPWQLSEGITAVPVASLDACVTDSRSTAPLLIPTAHTCPCLP